MKVTAIEMKALARLYNWERTPSGHYKREGIRTMTVPVKIDGKYGPLDGDGRYTLDQSALLQIKNIAVSQGEALLHEDLCGRSNPGVVAQFLPVYRWGAA